MKKTIGEVIEYIETLAPTSLRASWDHIGLMLGDVQKEAERILFTLDVTPEVVDEAIDKKVSLIVSHHPFFFRPIQRIDLSTSLGQMIERLLINQIAVYSAHSNLDAAAEGVNDVLADLLNLKHTERIEKYHHKTSKLLFYVDPLERDPLIEKLFSAGGFRQREASYVTVETTHEDQLPVRKDRVEMLVASQELDELIKVLRRHDSEQAISYDIIEVNDKDSQLGLGIVGDLPSSMTLETLAREMTALLHLTCIRVAGHNNHIVTRVGICGGAGKSLMAKAQALGAQVMITGDVDYHSALEAQAMGLMVIDASHYATEKPAMVALSERVGRAMQVACEFSENSKDIIRVIE